MSELLMPIGQSTTEDDLARYQFNDGTRIYEIKHGGITEDSYHGIFNPDGSQVAHPMQGRYRFTEWVLACQALKYLEMLDSEHSLVSM